MSLFGAADRNAERRKAEGKAYKEYKKQWRFNRDEAKKAYKFKRDEYKNKKKDTEANLRFQEDQLIQNFEAQQAMRDYEFNTATRAYEKSVEQAAKQKEFNYIAEQIAFKEQSQKRSDDLLAVMFNESQSFLDYQSNITGLKMDKHNQLVQADFDEARIETKFVGDVAAFEIERRKARSDSMFEAQKVILQGMKEAGRIAASGNTGRSAHKAAIASLAESGMLRSAISNGLMYAEQSIDLGIAQLKDMLILDQTMVLAARDRANNAYNLQSAKLDADRKLDKLEFDSTRKSIDERDKIVRRQILNARKQADMNAEAQILLQPEKLPDLPDPRVMYAKYDNPDTEYVEMLLRPRFPKFPKFDYPDHMSREDFKGPRENVGLSNFADVLKIGGAALGGVGAIGATGDLAGIGIGATPAFDGVGTLATTYSTAGAALGSLGDSFYPR